MRSSSNFFGEKVYPPFQVGENVKLNCLCVPWYIRVRKWWSPLEVGEKVKLKSAKRVYSLRMCFKVCMRERQKHQMRFTLAGLILEEWEKVPPIAGTGKMYLPYFGWEKVLSPLLPKEKKWTRENQLKWIAFGIFDVHYDSNIDQW